MQIIIIIILSMLWSVTYWLYIFCYIDVGSSGFGSSDSLDGISHSPSPMSTGMKRVASSGSTLGLTNVFNMMWRTLLQLTLDPFPSVNQQAGIIVNTLKNKVNLLPILIAQLQYLLAMKFWSGIALLAWFCCCSQIHPNNIADLLDMPVLIWCWWLKISWSLFRILCWFFLNFSSPDWRTVTECLYWFFLYVARFAGIPTC